MNRQRLVRYWLVGMAIGLCVGAVAGIWLQKLHVPHELLLLLRQLNQDGEEPAQVGTHQRRTLPGDDGIVLLKRLIADEYPAVGKNDTGAWVKAILLRQWAHEHVLFGTESVLLDKDKEFNYYQRDAPAIFSAFFADKGGVWCGGAAYALMRLYQAYGFDSYTYNCGATGVSTHVLTLVKLNFDGKSILSIQDPTFDICYVDPQGSPYGLFDVIRLLKERRHDLIRAKPGDARPPKVLVHPTDRGGKTHLSFCAADDRPVESLADGRLKYVFGARLGAYWEEASVRSAKMLKKDSRPVDPKYLLLYPININDGRGEVASLWREVRRMIGQDNATQ